MLEKKLAFRPRTASDDRELLGFNKMMDKQLNLELQETWNINCREFAQKSAKLIT